MALAVGVLALQGDVREHEQALRRVGAEPRRVRSADELDGLDGLVIPGGESTTIGKLAVLFGVLEPIVSLVREGMPVFGSCAGMILLADEIRDQKAGQPAIGGLEIAVRRNAFGRQVASFESDLDIHVIGAPAFRAVFIRAPWVEDVSDNVTVLATISGTVQAEGTNDAAGRIVAVRQGPMLATAFHPELTGDDRIHAFFADIVRGRA